MIKPVKIISTDKIRNFNDKVRNGLEHALNFMLGTDDLNKIQISQFEAFLMPIDTYINAYKKQSILVKIHAEKAFEGELYWFFELKTAIALGSLMRMMPSSSIEERLTKNIFDATDQDSFGEVGNQLCGILDRAFRTITKKNIHLRMDFNKKVYPDESIKIENFVNKEEYIVLLCNITLPKYGAQKLTLLMPRTLYEVLLNMEIQLEGVQPKKVLVYSWNELTLEKVQIAMNSRDVKVVAIENQDDIFNKVDMHRLCAVGIDLPGMSFPLSMQDSIFIKRLASNKSLLKLPYFLTWDNPTEQGLKELESLGLKGATTGQFMANFPAWAKVFTNS